MFAEINKALIHSLPFVLQSVGAVEYQKPVFRPDGFSYHQIIWVHSGTGHFVLDGESMELQAGEGAFMRAGVPHSYEGDPFGTRWLTFSLSETTLDYLGVGRAFRFTVPHNLNAETDHLIAFANGDSDALSRSGAGYLFVTEFFSGILRSSENLPQRVQNFLEQNYSQPLSLLDISQRLGVDRYALCRIYKKECGTTIMNELLRIRIAKAKRFLKYGSQSIAEIGQMCGFENSCYFIKRFHEEVGCTPANYRLRRG